MNVAAERVSYHRPSLSAGLPLVFIAPLWLLSFTPRASTNDNLLATLWVSAAALAAWWLILLFHSARTGRALAFDVQIVRTHYVQALVHTSIFVYWAQYWRFIEGQALLILAQVLFAYAFQALLVWSRGQRWRFGFGPLPIILSTNFFMCFRDHWFYLQFALIALGMLGKELIQWRKDGRMAHIFNPSSFGLFVFSVGLIATGMTDITWAEDIAIKLDRPEHIYLFIFLAGLVVQGLFRVTYVTFAAALTLYVLNIAYLQLTGIYWFMDAGIPIAVFLGLHLLITDPATSPRSNSGRFIFGVLYGLGVFLAYGLLEWAGAPRFYDKLLCVPILNLMVPWVDRLAGALPLAKLPGFSRLERLSANAQNLVCMGVWAALFVWMSATNFIGKDHPGLKIGFWEHACTAGLHNGCRNLTAIHVDNCSAGDTEACRRLADLAGGPASSSQTRLTQARALARACDLSDAQACFNLQRILDADGRKQLEASCRAREAQSCYVLGSAHLMGIGFAPDLAQAFRYFSTSCDLGSATGCSVMSDGYRLGVGVPKDLQRARLGYEAACNQSYLPSCVALAAMLAQGEGVPQNVRRAQALLGETCLLGLAQACKTL